MRVIVINRSYAIKYLQVLNTNTHEISLRNDNNCELHIIFEYLINFFCFFCNCSCKSVFIGKICFKYSVLALKPMLFSYFVTVKFELHG